MLKQAFPMEVNMNLTTFSVGSLGKLNGKIVADTVHAY